MRALVHFFRKHYKGNVANDVQEYSKTSHFLKLPENERYLVSNDLQTMDDVCATQLYSALIENEETMNVEELANHLDELFRDFVGPTSQRTIYYLVSWTESAYIGSISYGLRQNHRSVSLHIPIFCKNWGITWKAAYSTRFYYRYADDQEFRTLTTNYIVLNDVVFCENVHDDASRRIQVWTSIRPCT